MPSTLIQRRFAGRTRDLGGFQVRRVLPFARHRMVGPFVFFDQIGPARFEAGDGIDVRPHPHIGLATVTYLFEGALLHRDSLSVEQTIRPGDVNWMVAGKGIVHSERTPPEERAAGHSLYGVQTWLALPESHEDAEPAFHHHARESLPAFIRDEIHFRLILGTAWGEESPVEIASPAFYLHGEMPAGSATRIDIDHEERAVYLVEGAVTLDGDALEPGEMAVLERGVVAQLAASQGSTVMLCGGSSPGQRHIDWNFVASDLARIERAKAHWTEAAAQGFPENVRFTLPPGESEHIPLPGDTQTGKPVKPSPGSPTS